MDLNINSFEKFRLEKSAVKPDNLFSLPKDYFKNLEDQIQSQINLRLVSLDQAGIKKPPIDYFNHLEPRVLNRITSNSFKIPETYFNSLSKKILGKIEESIAMESILDPGIGHPFIVKDGYFGNLSNDILNKIPVEQDFKSLDLTLIKSLSEKNIEIKTNPVNPGFRKVWQLPSTQFISRFLVAASLALLITFVGIKITKNQNLNNDKYPKLTQEEGLKYRYGVDESVLEDEIINQDVSLGSQNSLNKNDQYLLSHSDDNTLMEEL